MQTNIAIIGFGVIGTEILSKICERYNNKYNRKLNIVIVEKNLKNIPGGDFIVNISLNLVFSIIHLEFQILNLLRGLKKKRTLKNYVILLQVKNITLKIG